MKTYSFKPSGQLLFIHTSHHLKKVQMPGRYDTQMSHVFLKMYMNILLVLLLSLSLLLFLF